MANEPVPQVAKREGLLKAMTPELQKVAKSVEKKLATGRQGLVLIAYDIGAMVKRVIDDEPTYGAKAVEQLADYLQNNGGTTALYALRGFATEFTRESVKAEVVKLREDGQALETGHFLAICKVKSKKEQRKLFNRVRNECLSSKQLEAEIKACVETRNTRSSGRKPQQPKTPAAGLQKLYGQAQQLGNYLSIVNDSVFEPLLEVAPDQVNVKLVGKFQEAREQLTRVVKDGQGTLLLMGPVAERLNKILGGGDGEAEAEPAGQTPPRKTAKKKTTAKKGTGRKTAATKKGTKKVASKPAKKKKRPSRV